MKRWSWMIVVVLLAACDAEEEESVPKIPEPPYMGKPASFYDENAGAFDQMWAWCEKYVASVRTYSQSLECGTVRKVHMFGGPKERRKPITPAKKLESSPSLPRIPDVPGKADSASETSE